MRKMIMAVMVLILIALPAMAATNSYTTLRTTTSELSNSAWVSGYSISGDRMTLAGGVGRYVSDDFYLVNITSADVSYSSYADTEDMLDYGWVYSNTLWLNSTDARHVTGGHAYYTIRYPFSTGTTSTTDAWFTDSSACSDATINGATIMAVINKPYMNYIDFDGTDDYARTTYAYDYDAGWWCIAAMVKSDGTAGSPIGISDADSNAVIELQYIDSTSDCWQLLVRDQNNNAVAAANASKTVTPNAWHFIVMRADATTLYLYCDGVLQCSIDLTYNSSSQLNLDYLQLGGIYYSGDNIADWAGNMDEFRFLAGSLPISECSNSGLMGTYMWNCVNGNYPSKAASYNFAGAGNIYTCIYGRTIVVHYIDDISMTNTNTKPTYSAVFPPDGYDYTTSPTVTLSVTAHDADLAYATPLTAQYFLDGVSQGTSTVLVDGNIDKNIGTPTGGSHTWYGLVYDPWSGSITTDTYHFNVRDSLYVRDETDFENLIDDATVTVNFYTENTSATKTTSNGAVDLNGLPITDILVTASADGYYSRKTIVRSLYETQNVYLINENESVIYNTFKLNTQSISYPVTEYSIDIQKPMNGTVDTVFSSYFGFDGSCGTYLIESDVYRLVIHAPDGTDITYGWLYPDPDGTMEITISSGITVDMVTDWLTTSLIIDDESNSFTYSYSSSIDIDTATFVVTEDNETLQDYSVDTNTGTFVYQSDSNRHNLFMNVSIVAVDGNNYNILIPISLNSENINPFPSSYPDWFKQVIVSAIAIVCILAFSSYRADVGCILAAGVFCTAYIFEWFPISQAVIYTIILIAAAAVIKFKRKRERVLY